MSGHNIACWTLNFSEHVLLKKFPLIDSKPWLKIELIRNFISELIDFRILQGFKSPLCYHVTILFNKRSIAQVMSSSSHVVTVITHMFALLKRKWVCNQIVNVLYTNYILCFAGVSGICIIFERIWIHYPVIPAEAQLFEPTALHPPPACVIQRSLDPAPRGWIVGNRCVHRLRPPIECDKGIVLETCFISSTWL